MASIMVGDMYMYYVVNEKERRWSPLFPPKR